MNPLAEIAPFINLGAAGILVAGAWWFSRWWLRQIASGELVSRREMDYLRADRDDRLAEKDEEIARALAAVAEWRAGHETSERARELQGEQVRDLTGAVREQNGILDEFRAAVERNKLRDPP